MRQRMKDIVVVCLITACLGFIITVHTVHAGIITGGNLLDAAGADRLEYWLGVGDQDFTNIWTGTVAGEDNTASSWHDAVDDAGATFSIYSMDIGGETHLIGG